MSRAGRRFLLRPVRPVRRGAKWWTPPPPLDAPGVATAIVNVSAPMPTPTLVNNRVVIGDTAVVYLSAPSPSLFVSDGPIIMDGETAVVQVAAGDGFPTVGTFVPGDRFETPIELVGMSGSVTAAGNLSTQAGETFPSAMVSSQWFFWKAPASGATLTITPSSSTSHIVEILSGTSVTDLAQWAFSDGTDGVPDTISTAVGGYEIVYVRVATPTSTANALPFTWSAQALVNELVLDLQTPNVVQTPSAITYSCFNAEPYEMVTFDIVGDGVTLDAGEADASGFVAPLTSFLSARNAGTYTLRAITASGATGYAALQVALDAPTLPTAVPADSAPPVIVQSGPVRYWVWNDPQPGGLGNWVMPRNPAEMSSPFASLPIDSAPTTAPNGTSHVWVGSPGGHTWTFTGTLLTQAEVEKVRDYCALQRRIRIIDHRNRAWTVIVEKLDMTPASPRQTGGPLYPYRHNYTVTALIVGGPVTP